MRPPLPLSVIVCTRNRASYLSDCLGSLAQQDCDTRFEIIVVDNASTDGTADVVADWCRRDARVRRVQETRVGLSIAKNTGVKVARGQLLLFTDDDVIVDRRWARSYVEFFERKSDGLFIAGGAIVPVPHDLGSWPAWFDLRALPDIGLLDYGEERPLRRYEYVWGANMAIPAERFSRVGSWDEDVGRQGEKRGTFEDTELQDRMRSMAGEVWFCPGARIQHRIPRDQIVPSVILRTAFARARNEFWGEISLQKERGQFAPCHEYTSGVALLAGRLAAFAFWSLAFAIRPTPSSFGRAHAAAAASGRTMDVLRAGRETTRISTAIGRGSFLVLDSVLSILRAVNDRRG